MENLDKEFVKLAQKSRKKRRWLTVLISLGVTLGVIAGLLFLNAFFVNQSYRKTITQLNIYSEITNPNITYNAVSGDPAVSSTGIFGGSIGLSFVKNVDGYLVPWSYQNVSYGTLNGLFFGSDAGSLGNSSGQKMTNSNGFASSNGQKVIQFFNSAYVSPSVPQKAPQEAQTLSKLPNYLAEVAVTFDQPYTYKQIQQMIPSNLMLNWYWLGINDTTMDSAELGGGYFGLSGYTSIDTNSSSLYYASIMVPPHTAKEDGTLDNTSYNRFVSAVKKIPQYFNFPETTLPKSETGGVSVPVFNAWTDIIKQVEKYPTLDKAKFSGVILTGRTENFAQLTGKSWVYATSVGVTTPVLPYEAPLK